MTEERNEKKFIDSVVSVRRVTKVTQGGKRFSFSAFVVSGDQNGNVGYALGSGREVSAAIAKATLKARKNMMRITIRNKTIPYSVKGRHGSSMVIMRSAYPGTGVIAGGAVRAVMKAAGIENVLAKSLGASNQLNVVKATLNALAQLRSLKQISRLRGIKPEEVIKGAHGAVAA